MHLDHAGLEKISIALDTFDCRNGDPRPYHTDEHEVIHPYVVLGFIGDSASAVAEALAAELHRVRRALPASPSPVLYIRRNPEVEQEPSGIRWRASVRIAVPGIDWSKFSTKPEGAPYLQV